MRKLLALAAAASFVVGPVVTAHADPAADQATFQNFFKQKFPDVKFAEFSNGVYAIDADSRSQWQAIEEFPPYEAAIEDGQRMLKTPFANGKSYADCFENGGIGIVHKYPFFDTKRNEVITLPLAINECRKSHNEKPLNLNRGDITSLLAYMAFTTRGKISKVEIPNDAAKAAYESGKKYYYTRRGQLNMACAHCHVDNAGKRIRSDLLSPPIGHTTHWPVFRGQWDELGTLQRRFSGCNEQVRAKASAPESVEYRNLEYFLTYMSNGLPMNGPAFRK